MGSFPLVNYDLSLKEFERYCESVLAGRRHNLILDTLKVDGSVSTTQLVRQLGQSPATIRRDLISLDEEGLLRRVYGGAVSNHEDDEPFDDVAAVHVRSKFAIATKCAELIQDGQTVLLDIGTTAQQVAAQLHGRRLTVITTNLAVFDELESDENIELVVLGGSYRRQYRSLVGFLAEDALRQIRADVLILGTSGVDAEGVVMDTTLIEVPIKRAMIEASDKVILAADSSKFPGVGVAKVCGPRALNAIVTEEDTDKLTLSTFQNANVDIHLVPAART